MILVLIIWSVVYLSVFGLIYGIWGISSLTNLAHTIIALSTYAFAWWAAGRFYDEND